MKYKFKENGFISEYKDDSFFDSLRADYKEFDTWYDKSVDDEQKSSHYWLKDGNVVAFIGFKVEDETIEVGEKKLPKAKRLKITTIKSEGIKGFTEFVVYQATKKAMHEGVNEIYFSVIPDTESKQKLMAITEAYGFDVFDVSNYDKNGNKRGSLEYYLLKDMTCIPEHASWKTTYPRLSINEKTSVGIAVFEGAYHDTYIQDADLKDVDQSSNRDFTKMGIQKAYIHSQIVPSSLPPGSIILIYRKGDKIPKRFSSVITGYGVVTEQFKKGVHYSDFAEFKKIVKEKHAFESDEVLKEWFKSKRYITMFALYKSFGEGHNITLDFLKRNNIIGDEAPYKYKINPLNFIKIYKEAI